MFGDTVSKHLFCLIKKNIDIGKTLKGTEVCFASFLSGGFTTMAVINPPERKLTQRTSLFNGLSSIELRTLCRDVGSEEARGRTSDFWPPLFCT